MLHRTAKVFKFYQNESVYKSYILLRLPLIYPTLFPITTLISDLEKMAYFVGAVIGNFLFVYCKIFFDLPTIP